jgi:hypothetical protein
MRMLANDYRLESETKLISKVDDYGWKASIRKTSNKLTFSRTDLSGGCRVTGIPSATIPISRGNVRQEVVSHCN